MNLKRSAILSSRARQWAASLGCLFTAAVVVVACSSGTVNTSSGMSTVNVMLSDPATCQAPSGPFSKVIVTITDVKANVSSTAADTDSSWVDLTPGLASTPKQIDLLGQANNQCFLATLGSTQQLQAGNYQQIRLILASNSTNVSNNLCTNGSANCVVLADNSYHTLNLSSEAQTGIKIPSGQIASGGFNIAVGQTKDLDIDFNTCSSIVSQGNGQYRLKPVLHAGEVSATSTSINGKVLDSATGNPLSGKALVAVEQKDGTGVFRIIMSTLAGSDGGFVFCPLPAGTYDVVVVGTTTGGALYQPSVVTGVAVGSTTGNILLHLPTTLTTPALANSSASLIGQVTSQNGANPPVGTVADAELSALETVNSNTYTIPLPPTTTQSSATTAVETAAAVSPATCPPGTGSPAGTTDCVAYTLTVPSGGAYYGAWSASGTTLTAPTALANYSVDGVASLSGAPDCSPSEVVSSTTPTVLASTVPYAVTGLNLNLKGCQ